MSFASCALILPPREKCFPVRAVYSKLSIGTTPSAVIPLSNPSVPTSAVESASAGDL